MAIVNYETKQEHVKTLEVKQLKAAFMESFKDLEKKKVAAKQEKDTLDSTKAVRDQKKNETMLAVKEDGSPLIDGKNETIRAAQINEKLKAIDEKLQEQQRLVANAEFEKELILDRLSMLRNLSRLTCSELNFLADSDTEGR